MMKVAVTTTDNYGGKAKISSRFGRAPYIAIIDVETQNLKFISNSAANSSSGAGVKAAQIIADEEVEVLIVPRIGPKAFKGLEQAGLDIYITQENTINEALSEYQNDNLERIDEPTNPGHIGY